MLGEQVGRWVSGQTSGQCMDRWVDEQTDEWKDEQTDGVMGRWWLIGMWLVDRVGKWLDVVG